MRNDQNLAHVKDFVKLLHTAANPKGSKRLYIYWKEMDSTLDVYKEINSEIEDKSSFKKNKAIRSH
jgi:hypothetical protein